MAHKVVQADQIEARNGIFRPLSEPLGVGAFKVNQLEFPPGHEGPEHDHSGNSEEEVYVIISGSGTLRVGEEEIAVSAGSYIFCPPDTRRQLKAGDDGLVYVGIGNARVTMASKRALPRVVAADAEPIWFLGTLTRIKLDGAQTGGRFAAFEVLLPRGASPPLHSHPQDETFYVLEGELTVWLVEDELAADATTPPAWVESRAQRCGRGAMAFAPAGTPHTFRVESDTALVLTLSTPAGIEDLVRELGEPARWPWLQAPQDGPRVGPERIAAVERELGMIRRGPPPPQRG